MRIAENTTYGLFYSTDNGINWTFSTNNLQRPSSVTMNEKIFCYEYDHSRVAVTDDCINFEVHETNAPKYFIGCLNNKLMGTGDNYLYLSEDGINWSAEYGNYYFKKNDIDITQNATDAIRTHLVNDTQTTESNVWSASKVESYINETILGGEW